jgi:hypothetical protein
LDSKEVFLPKQKVDPSLVTIKDVEGWYRSESTRTDWIEVKGNWLPKRVLLTWSDRNPKRSRDVEVDILEWKLGKEVDEALVDPDKFTKENIVKVPFDDWRKQFDAEQDKANKLNK